MDNYYKLDKSTIFSFPIRIKSSTLYATYMYLTLSFSILSFSAPPVILILSILRMILIISAYFFECIEDLSPDRLLILIVTTKSIMFEFKIQFKVKIFLSNLNIHNLEKFYLRSNISVANILFDISGFNSIKLNVKLLPTIYTL